MQKVREQECEETTARSSLRGVPIAKAAGRRSNLALWSTQSQGTRLLRFARNDAFERLSLAQARSFLTAGFTLVELLIAIVISGILVTVAMKSMFSMYDSARTEETKQEMEVLAFAITGNPSTNNNGERTDFGYVGDVGSLPPNLDALYQNPGGYTTWKGPYVANRFTQTADDYKRDATGNLYSYSGGLAITSSSGGSIIRQIANSTNELLRNSVTGIVCDIDGTPPGSVYKDSVVIVLVHPNGTGGLRTRTAMVDAAGYFAFDSIPIGDQNLTVVYRPLNDTMLRVMSVAPGSSVTTTCRFANDLWYSPPVSGGSLTLINGSDTVSGTHCRNVSFWVTNTSGSPVTISSMAVSWTSPTAYYGTIIWGATTVFNLSGSPRGVANTNYALSANQTLNAGQSVKISVNEFRKLNSAGGGSMINMDNVPFTIRFSGGSVMTFTTNQDCGG